MIEINNRIINPAGLPRWIPKITMTAPLKQKF